MPCKMHTDLWQQNCVHALLSAGAPANPQVTPCIGMMHPLPSWESKAAQQRKAQRIGIRRHSSVGSTPSSAYQKIRLRRGVLPLRG